MSFLTTLLPGVRQMRTPLTVGVLWLVVLSIVFPADLLAGGAMPPLLGNAIRYLSELHSGYLLIAGVVAAYVLGGLLDGLSLGFTRKVLVPLLHVLVALLARIERFITNRWPKRGLAPLGGHLWPSLQHDVQEEASVRGPIIDRIAEMYATLGAPHFAALCFPIDSLIERLDTTALQVWSKEPAQYQEYDRLGAEAEFRAGIGLPLFVLALVAVPMAHWLIIPIAIVLVLTLARKYLALRTQMATLMANALYLGVAQSPLVSGVERSLGQLVSARVIHAMSGWATWWAATAVSLVNLSEYDAADAVLREIATIDQEADFESAAKFLADSGIEGLTSLQSYREAYRSSSRV